MTRLGELLSEDEAFVSRMPTNKAGLLFLKDSKWCSLIPIAWRSIKPMPGEIAAEITAAMFENYY
jgi:hypothetical protein